MKRCTCGQPTFAVHKDDSFKPIKDRRVICECLYDFYSQYVNGSADWIRIRLSSNEFEKWMQEMAHGHI